MKGLNISDKCKEEWEQTLNVSVYCEKIDDSLSSDIIKFLNIDDYSEIQNNPEIIKNIILGLADILGVHIKDVKFIQKENSSVIGGYQKEDESIVFNLSNNNFINLDRCEFLTAIVHELRHAQQHQIISFAEYKQELANEIKKSFKNYVHPDGKMVRDAKYFSNFAEVDAEIFSYIFMDNAYQRMMNNPKLADQSMTIKSAMKSHSEAHKEFKRQLNLSLTVMENNGKTINNLVNLITNFIENLCSNNGLSQENLNAQSEFLISQCESLFNGKEKDLIDFTQENFYALQILMYQNADTIELSRHLDNPFIKYFEGLEDKFHDPGITNYGRYTRRIKVMVEKCKDFLKDHNIPYNENDNGDIINAVIDNMPEIYLQNFINHANCDIKKLQRDHDMCSLIDSMVVKDKNYLHLRCAKYVEERLSKKQIRTLLESLVDNGIKETFDSGMIRDLLDSYAIHYYIEKKFHTYEEFLNLIGINKKFKGFSEIMDKLEVELPKFVVKCLFKKQLTDEEQKLIRYIGSGDYGKINTEILKKEIEKQLFSKTKLKQLFEAAAKEDGEKNIVLKALEELNINLKELLEEKTIKQKNK